MAKYDIKAHKDQAKGSGQESHHIDSKASAKAAVAGYSKSKAPTVMLDKAEHDKVTSHQKTAQGLGGRGAQNVQNQQNFQKSIGLSKTVKETAEALKAAGVPETRANAAALASDGYVKGTTPLNQVKSVISNFMAKKAGGAPVKSAPGPGSGAMKTTGKLTK